MKNLEQIRAQNALEAAKIKISGVNGGEVIKKIPPLIMNHGLLAIGAYAFDEKNKGFKEAVDAIAKHLASDGIALLPEEYHADATGLMQYLSGEATSEQLRQCTAETMAWLNFAQRFIKKEPQGE